MAGHAGVGGPKASRSRDGMDDGGQTPKPTAPMPRNHVGKYLLHRQLSQTAAVAAEPPSSLADPDVTLCSSCGHFVHSKAEDKVN